MYINREFSSFRVSKESANCNDPLGRLINRLFPFLYSPRRDDRCFRFFNDFHRRYYWRVFPLDTSGRARIARYFWDFSNALVAAVSRERGCRCRRRKTVQFAAHVGRIATAARPAKTSSTGSGSTVQMED